MNNNCLSMQYVPVIGHVNEFASKIMLNGHRDGLGKDAPPDTLGQAEPSTGTTGLFRIRGTTNTSISKLTQKISRQLLQQN